MRDKRTKEISGEAAKEIQVIGETYKATCLQPIGNNPTYLFGEVLPAFLDISAGQRKFYQWSDRIVLNDADASSPQQLSWELYERQLSPTADDFYSQWLNLIRKSQTYYDQREERQKHRPLKSGYDKEVLNPRYMVLKL